MRKHETSFPLHWINKNESFLLPTKNLLGNNPELDYLSYDSRQIKSHGVDWNPSLMAFFVPLMSEAHSKLFEN